MEANQSAKLSLSSIGMSRYWKCNWLARAFHFYRIPLEQLCISIYELKNNSPGNHSRENVATELWKNSFNESHELISCLEIAVWCYADSTHRIKCRWNLYVFSNLLIERRSYGVIDTIMITDMNPSLTYTMTVDQRKLIFMIWFLLGDTYILHTYCISNMELIE